MNITKSHKRDPKSEIEAAIAGAGGGVQLDRQRLITTALDMQKSGEISDTPAFRAILGLAAAGEESKEFAPLGGKTGVPPLSKEFKKELNGHSSIDRI